MVSVKESEIKQKERPFCVLVNKVSMVVVVINGAVTKKAKENYEKNNGLV